MNLDTARTPEQPSATMAGTVERIVPPSRPNQPEQAQIALDVNRECVIDEHGDDVRLKKGGHVQVTVRRESKTSIVP